MALLQVLNPQRSMLASICIVAVLMIIASPIIYVNGFELPISNLKPASSGRPKAFPAIAASARSLLTTSTPYLHLPSPGSVALGSRWTRSSLALEAAASTASAAASKGKEEVKKTSGAAAATAKPAATATPAPAAKPTPVAAATAAATAAAKKAKEEAVMEEEERQMTREETLSSVLHHIDKIYGKGSILRLGDASSMNIETFSSGALTLDLALGGGYPKGRVIEIFGPESSGKTTLALHAVASLQKDGGKTSYSH